MSATSFGHGEGDGYRCERTAVITFRSVGVLRFLCVCVCLCMRFSERHPHTRFRGQTGRTERGPRERLVRECRGGDCLWLCLCRRHGANSSIVQQRNFTVSQFSRHSVNELTLSLPACPRKGSQEFASQWNKSRALHTSRRASRTC